MTKPPTPRELQVLAASLRAGSTKAAAHELGISDATVRNHLSRLYGRLDVDCMSQAAAALGWLDVDKLVTSVS